VDCHRRKDWPAALPGTSCAHRCGVDDLSPLRPACSTPSSRSSRLDRSTFWWRRWAGGGGAKTPGRACNWTGCLIVAAIGHDDWAGSLPWEQWHQAGGAGSMEERVDGAGSQPWTAKNAGGRPPYPTILPPAVDLTVIGGSNLRPVDAPARDRQFTVKLHLPGNPSETRRGRAKPCSLPPRRRDGPTRRPRCGPDAESGASGPEPARPEVAPNSASEWALLSSAFRRPQTKSPRHTPSTSDGWRPAEDNSSVTKKTTVLCQAPGPL